MQRLRPALAGLLLSACATVSERPAPVEAPVSRGKQIAAQSAAQAPAAHRYKTKIAIARFTNESNYGRSLLTDQDLDRIGKQAGDMLMSRLVLSGKFLVLERPDAAKLEREQKLSGGSMIGADTVIAGSVTEFGRSVGGKSGFLSSTKLQTAKAKVDIRLVDVQTGLAYFSANGSGEASTESGEIAGFGSRAEYDATLNDRAIAAAISDVVDRLVDKLYDRPWRTDILEVRGTQLFIAGGERQGLRPGDTLAVLQATGTAKSKQSGFQITLPPRQVATVRVVSLFGDSETNEGSVCELASGTVDPGALATLYVAEPGRGGTP
jgi:curli biogenesis system outer membrane secretion channel CsgG